MTRIRIYAYPFVFHFSPFNILLQSYKILSTFAIPNSCDFAIVPGIVIIGELFAQKKHIEKGWFPLNPDRKSRITR